MGIYILLYLYIILLSVAFYNKVTTSKGKKLFLGFAFIPMFLIQALRGYTIGEDTAGYIYHYHMIGNMGWNSLDFTYNGFEPGYIFLNKVVAFLSDNNTTIFLAVVSGIIMVGFSIFIYYNSTNVILSTMLFVALNHFFTSMVSLRQYIAIAFLINSFYFFRKRKLGIMLLLCATSFLFHKSSIIFSALILGLYFIKLTRNKILLLIGIGLTGAVCFPSLLALALRILPKYNYYFIFIQNFTNAMGIGKIRIIYLSFEIALIGIILVVKKYGNRDFYALAMITSVAAISILLQGKIPYLWRLSYYFEVYLIILIPNIFYKKTSNGYLYKISIFASITIFYVYLLLTNAAEIVPYKMFFRY